MSQFPSSFGQDSNGGSFNVKLIDNAGAGDVRNVNTQPGTTVRSFLASNVPSGKDLLIRVNGRAVESDAAQAEATGAPTLDTVLRVGDKVTIAPNKVQGA